MKNSCRDIRSKLIEDPAFALEAAKGEFIMAVTELICEKLEAGGIERQELARRLGKSKAYVSQLLSGSRNMTLATLGEIAHVLGYTPVMQFESEGAEAVTLESDVNLDQTGCEYYTRDVA